MIPKSRLKATAAQIQFEEKFFQASEDGFVPLTLFSYEIFDLSADDLRSFFDPEDRLYNKYENVRQGLRHNVHYTKNNNCVAACVGGIFYEDFSEFIRRTRLAIHANDQTFDQAIQEWREQSNNGAPPAGGRPLKLLVAKALKSLATLSKRFACTTR